MLISDEVRNAILNAAAALVNGGTMLFREATTARVTFTLKTPAFAAASAGDANLDVTSPTMSAAAASNAAVALDNYQIRTSGGAVRMSGDVGVTGSGAEIELNHVNVKTGDIVTVDDYTLSMPSGA
jgi:hypothetical protein